MKLQHFILTLLLTTSLVFAQQPREDGLYAELKTSKGTILLELAFEKAPVTVANFVSLAEGKNNYVTDQLKGKPFYDGLKFHRVISNFMIQGGDPEGTGAGNPGYKFTDEFTDLLHDGPGVLSMANSGPKTNGSQFFITHKETAWLNGKHTVFGKVIKGQDVVDAIQQNDTIEKVTIIKKGKAAKKFKAEKVFKYYMENKDKEDKRIATLNEENKKKLAELEEAKRKEAEALAEKTKKELEAKYAGVYAEKAAYLKAKKAEALQLPSGLSYVILEKGTDEKPAVGTPVKVGYSGFFEDGKLFDSSYEEVSKTFGKFDQNRANANAYTPIPSTAGQHRFVPGFAEGVDLLNFGDKAILFIPSKLAYGEKGAGGVIPPNTDLVFEVELVK